MSNLNGQDRKKQKFSTYNLYKKQFKNKIGSQPTELFK